MKKKKELPKEPPKEPTFEDVLQKLVEKELRENLRLVVKPEYSSSSDGGTSITVSLHYKNQEICSDHFYCD